MHVAEHHFMTFYRIDPVREIRFYTDSAYQNEVDGTFDISMNDVIYVNAQGNYMNETIEWMCNNDTASMHVQTGQTIYPVLFSAATFFSTFIYNST